MTDEKPKTEDKPEKPEEKPSEEAVPAEESAASSPLLDETKKTVAEINKATELSYV